jgi:pimeloyl-ACP methyl ester carboxylesterase
MKRIRNLVLLTAFALALAGCGARAYRPPAARTVDLKAVDGAILKASYFGAGKPGPGVLLLHQINRQRKVWDGLAERLAAVGIHTLTFDVRGLGESSGGPYGQLPPAERAKARKLWPDDMETAFQYLVAQPGVRRDVIGLGGAGPLGADNAVEAARRHSADVKSMVLISGQTEESGRQFIRQASQLPALFVAADADEYPPTEEVTEWLYALSSNPGRKFIHYAGEKAPWKGYEDTKGVPATGNHGTDLFRTHPELPGTIVNWYVTTLIATPGRAPADSSSSSALPVALLDEIETPGGPARAAAQLKQARLRDPQAQLWPWVVVNVLGYDHLQAGDMDAALEILKLNVLANPESADANDSLSDVYLAHGQKDLARHYAGKALALLASDTADSPERRNAIRDSAQSKLKQLGAH